MTRVYLPPMRVNVHGRPVTLADRLASVERLEKIGDRALRQLDDIETQMAYWEGRHRAEDIMADLREKHRALHRRLAFAAECRRATLKGGRA